MLSSTCFETYKPGDMHPRERLKLFVQALDAEGKRRQKLKADEKRGRKKSAPSQS